MPMCVFCRREANDLNGTAFGEDVPKLGENEQCRLCGKDSYDEVEMFSQETERRRP
jgi:hypothetical protein